MTVDAESGPRIEAVMRQPLSVSETEAATGFLLPLAGYQLVTEVRGLQVGDSYVFTDGEDEIVAESFGGDGNTVRVCVNGQEVIDCEQQRRANTNRFWDTLLNDAMRMDATSPRSDGTTRLSDVMSTRSSQYSRKVS